MKVVDIVYRRVEQFDGRDLMWVGFLGANCLFQFYPDYVNHWAESGDLKMVARFNIKRLDDVRDK